MDTNELIEEIKIDLGNDINSLGISDSSIELKIQEAIRKIGSYAPYIKLESFNVEGNKVVLPEDTIMVASVLTIDTVSGTGVSVYNNDQDLFSYSRYLYNYNDLSDPYIFLMQRNALNTLQQFISIKDWRFEKYNHTLYLSNYSKNTVSVQYLRKYMNLEEIEDTDILQIIKEYALALCKIIEGNIRRKLQSAPGAISMDGDALVSEGTAEKSRLDEYIPKQFSYLRFGVRC